MRGRKPQPTAMRRAAGNPGKRGYNHDEPVPPDGMPACPDHLSIIARDEWDRIAPLLHAMGVLTLADRAVMAAYCQAYGRWVEAEERLRNTPMFIKTQSGYIQQSPWLSIANKQVELMGRAMIELGLTPAARSRLVAAGFEQSLEPITRIEHVIVYPETEEGGAKRLRDEEERRLKDEATPNVRRIYLEGDL